MSYALGAPEEGSNVSANLKKLNDTVAKAIRPLHGAIDRMPWHGDLPTTKQTLKERPVDALLDLFEPIEHYAADIIEEANRISGKQTRVVGIPPTKIDMRPIQSDDARLDITTRNFVRRLRMLSQIMTLILTGSPSLAGAIATITAQRGLKWTSRGMQALHAPHTKALGLAPLLPAVAGALGISVKTLIGTTITIGTLVIPAMITAATTIAIAAIRGSSAKNQDASSTNPSVSESQKILASSKDKIKDGAEGATSSNTALFGLAALAAGAYFFMKKK